ncbi:MAG TPA: efflux RND transporter permease subunit [Cyclobacteriaceae bacterium]|nr:efflux RND transporter permease subunit [Cyclobacteriaceae bacterium]
MNLLQGALRKPVTVVVFVLAIVFFSILSARNMKIDIFPVLGLPTIYVAQPYGGLSPEQIEGLITSYYEYHFLYVTGVKYVESRSIQGATILKVQFQDGTDMAQAMAEIVGYVNRSRAFMPLGTVPPFITRFDAGSVPVGQLVFTSETRSLGEIQDLALFRVRPMFATLPGVSAPPPFGGNQKTVIIKVDPDKLKNYKLSPDQVVQSIARSNTITPAGNVRIGDETFLTPQNTIVENFNELGDVPITLGAGPAVYIRDIAQVQLGADVTTSYALINGKRSIYIPVTKRATASTWDVVKNVKAALPDMQAAVPDDIIVTYEFDQSGYVINSLMSLMFEGGLGAILTGLMVLLFLRDRRSALIVVLTIPLALLTGVTFLFLAGQTINIMTLGGLALSVGILVDQATVTIENIHQHLEQGESKTKAILYACREISIPLLLILLSILAVFIPSIFMSGVPKGMFLPLSLSVGFSMIASFFLALTFVPVMSNWVLKDTFRPQKAGRFEHFRSKYLAQLERVKNRSRLVSGIYFLISFILLIVFFRVIGTEIFPKVDAGQAQVRMRLPDGTRLERTEEATQFLLKLADSVSRGNIEITSSFVGMQPSSYPINTVYLWTSGPHEAVVKFNLTAGAGITVDEFKEKLRDSIKKNIPAARLSFEPGDLVDQVLNLGSNNPIEIAITGRNQNQTRRLAENLESRLRAVPYLRDVQIATPLDYPTIKIDIDRVKAGQLGLSVDQIGKSTVAATSSSRFTQPIYWLDKNTGTAYQVQVEYPQYIMNSTEDIELIPVSNDPMVFLRDVATWKKALSPGEYDRLNQQRFITLTANIHEKDLGFALKQVNESITSLGRLPAGVRIIVKGQAELLSDTMNELQSGLLIAIVVIFLLLAIHFQSFRLALVTLSILPAVIAGSLLLLLVSGNSLNIQSYMGTIMAVGVAIANSILFITHAEHFRRAGNAFAYHEGAFHRLRPILMTSLAMIAGMIPMSLGIGEAGDQVAPLGIAVIGGLIFSLFSTLLFLPLIYHSTEGGKKYSNVSLDPEDMSSRYYSES